MSSMQVRKHQHATTWTQPTVNKEKVMSQLDSLSDSAVNFNDQPTNQLISIQAQAPKTIGFMDFSNIEQAIKASELISQAPGFCPKDFLMHKPRNHVIKSL